jgi:ribosomal protein S18 acetylase RimI-like enzyme
VKIRPATTSDEAALRSLWEEFEAEVPEPAGFQPDTWGEDWADMSANIETGAVFIAEDDEGAVGLAEARAAEPGRWHLDTVYVRPRARRQGVAKALVAACAAAAGQNGVTHVSLEVVSANQLAMDVWQRLGFEPVEVVMATPLDALVERLGDAPLGPSRATTHVQTDDRVAVDRAISQFQPKLSGSDVRSTTRGWIRIAEPQLDADREAHSRFAQDLSDRLGGVVVALALEHDTVVRFRLYERGRMLDEYLSVPDFYGTLDRADELAMEANPTLVARLTGADREEVRRVARTAASAAELPPAKELYEAIAGLMGLEP